jgi:hypothetical protein
MKLLKAILFEASAVIVASIVVIYFFLILKSWFAHG